MDNLLKATLKSQTIPSGALFVISLIAWPIVIDILRDFQGKDRLQFNCVPKLNEVTRQLCYDKYNSAMSPRLTPLDFAGITFGLSSFGWLIVTLVNHWLLRRIRDKKISKANRKKNVDHYYWVFIGHICYQLALLVVIMVLFCCYQKLEYPAEYRCFSANTTLTVFNQVAVNFTCNDIRYNEKSKVNIVIIVVFSLSIVLSLAAIIQLKLQGKEKILEHLLRNLEEDEGEENASLDPSNNEPGTRADNDGPAVQYHAQETSRGDLLKQERNVRGRKEEIDDIVQALSKQTAEAEVAGVLVSGPAGIGKSTVAKQAGHRLKREYEASVKFCSLIGVSNEDNGVLREILDECVPGYQQGSEYPKYVLLNWCRQLDHDLVLIIDNAEDALRDDREDYSLLNLLGDMRMRSNFKIKFLITSRFWDTETAGRVSEIEFVKMQLYPLNVKESIEVLKDRAKLSSDRIEPDIQTKLHRIAELCYNIPLALRLAGSLLNPEESEYSPDDLVRELEKNLTKTLNLDPIMKIAFEKLDESLQHALVCLSVFDRFFTKDAAEALLCKVNCANYLTKLKKSSLIQKQGNRFLMHLLIRGYARQIGEIKFPQILALGEQRFIEHYLSQILRNANKYWRRDTCMESFHLFNEERINLEATLRVVGQQKIRCCGASKELLEDVVAQCHQVAPYIEYCVPFKMYDDFLEGLLHLSRLQKKITKEVEILCLLFHESRKHGEGDMQKSKDLIKQAIELHDDNLPCFDEEGLSEVFYLSHYGRYLSQDRNEREESQPFLEKAISICEKEAAKHLEHNFTFDKGKILTQMGHNAKLHKDGVKREAAVRYYSEALNFRLARYGKHLLTAFSYKEMGDYFLYIEELGKADENYKKALAILENMDVKEQKEVVPIYKNFGICYQKRKDFVRSREIFQLGRSVADNTIEGNHKWKVWINTYLALLLYKEYPDEKGEARIISAEVFQMGKELGMKKWPEKEALETFYKNQ